MQRNVPMPLISLTGIRVVFTSVTNRIHAVDTVDLSLDPGDRLALIGESGCGKTVLGMAVMGLLPKNAEFNGIIRYDDLNLSSLSARGMQEIRGREIAMISQNSVNALNPVMTVGEQIAEPLIFHKILTRNAAHDEASRLLRQMEFDEPDKAR